MTLSAVVDSWTRSGGYRILSGAIGIRRSLFLSRDIATGMSIFLVPELVSFRALIFSRYNRRAPGNLPTVLVIATELDT